MQGLSLRVVMTVLTRRLPASTPRSQCSLFPTSRPARETVDFCYYKYGRPFSTTPNHGVNGDYAQAAKDLNQKSLDEHESQFSDAISHEKQEKEKQVRTPWHRQGSDVPPVARPRSAGAMTKGKQAALDD